MKIIRKIIIIIWLLFISFFNQSLNAAWIQEDLSIAWNTTLQAKIEYLKDIENNWTVDINKINYNLTELKNLYKDWKISSFVKDNYIQAIMNNLYWIEINWELKRSYFWYKVVDDTEVISLTDNFLIEIQKNLDWTYRDPARTDLEAQEIAVKIQLFFENFINPTWNLEYGLFPKSIVFNHYTFIYAWNASWMALNSIFESVCSELNDKTICIENSKSWIIWIWLRDSVDPIATNQDEYKELIANYEISWKVQIPSILKARLEYLCPITESKPINWFIENNELEQCWLIAHDFDCDWNNEWIDINESLKTTTVYAINVTWSWESAILSIKVILYLNWKEIVKLYNNPGWCYSHILSKDWDDVTSNKIIYRNFQWNDLDNQFNLSSWDINWNTISQYKLTTKELTSDQYNFFSTNEIYSTWILNNYQINLDIKDTKPAITSTEDVLWLLALSSTNDISWIKLKILLNQDVFWFEKSDWTAKILFDTKKNWMTNSKNNHIQIKLSSWIASWYINWKKYFSYDISSNALNLEIWVELKEQTWTFSLSDFQLDKNILFSNQFTSWVWFEKEYSNFSISRPDSSKLYLYKLNQANDITNFYLGQIIDTFDFNYDFINDWTSTDDICKNFVKKDSTFFDNNLILNSSSNSYIGFDNNNGCDFLWKKVYHYWDLNWKLNYLKKVYITWDYNLTTQLFDFSQSEENILQWIDYWNILSWIIQNCTLTQVLNNELDTCSVLNWIDIDNDDWKEWILAKDWEFEIYNNIIDENILWDYTPNLQLLFKSSWDWYCTLLPQNIDYYKKWSTDWICRTETQVDELISINGGTKENCEVESALVTSWINDYQFIYWLIGSNAEDKKFTRTQILKNKPILCD